MGRGPPAVHMRRGRGGRLPACLYGTGHASFMAATDWRSDADVPRILLAVAPRADAQPRTTAPLAPLPYHRRDTIDDDAMLHRCLAHQCLSPPGSPDRPAALSRSPPRPIHCRTQQQQPWPPEPPRRRHRCRCCRRYPFIRCRGPSVVIVGQRLSAFFFAK